MIKNLCTICIALFLASVSFGQDQTTSFLSNAYVSGELSFRNYGTNDQSGFGGGIEVSKDVKKWLGLGLNVSYWNNRELDDRYIDPFNGTVYEFYAQVRDFKISPFAQIFPINTKNFDLFFKVGLRTGYYDQEYNLSGFSTDVGNQTFTVFNEDIGDTGINFGYELGLGFRVQISQFFFAPSFVFANDTNTNDFNALNLKIGWQLK